MSHESPGGTLPRWVSVPIVILVVILVHLLDGLLQLGLLGRVASALVLLAVAGVAAELILN